MYLYACFDVEDLVHPDSDDVALDLGEMLADDGIVASMCVVAEKARLWERRGRSDVISAIGQHDVSFHTNYHSIHPTISEYLANKGWLDGVIEAMRQEESGVHDLARIFGTFPSTWGTPGSSWGPQIPAATRQLGLPSNVYSLARSGETGACWFAGQLCYSDFLFFPGGEDAYADDAAFKAALPTLLQQISEARQQGFTCLGLFVAHPTRLRYTAFWDALNYARGQNTAPTDYGLAPRRSDEAYGTSLRNLRRMILAIRDLPGVEIISIRALNNRFRLDTGAIGWADVGRLAQAVVDNKMIRAEEPLASPAQTLDVLARAALRLANGAAMPTHLSLRRVLGPVDSPPSLEKLLMVNIDAGLELYRKMVRYISETGHLPSSLAVDDILVSPGSLLRAVAAVFLDLDRGLMPHQITLQPGAEEPSIAGRLAGEIYQQLPGWPPHSPDLKLDQLALHTRLQSWSLKPAVLAT